MLYPDKMARQLKVRVQAWSTVGETNQYCVNIASIKLPVTRTVISVFPKFQVIARSSAGMHPAFLKDSLLTHTYTLYFL